MIGMGFGDVAPEGLLPVVLISGLYLGVPVPIMCSYSCNFEEVLMGDCILSFSNGLDRGLALSCSIGGDARLPLGLRRSEEVLSRRRFSR